MAVNENKTVTKRPWAEVLGLVQARAEMPAPIEPLPDFKTQIEALEVLASELAKNGQDVVEASRILDTLRKVVQSEAFTTTSSFGSVRSNCGYRRLDLDQRHQLRTTGNK